MRSQTMFSCLLILAAGLFASCSESKPAADTRPNVVFVLLDDVRWDDLGAGGHPWVQTPNFDRIAHEGAKCRAASLTHGVFLCGLRGS